MKQKEIWLANLAAALCVCNAYAERQFRMGSPWPSSSTPHVGVVRFAQEVEKQSNGQMKVLVYPDSQLGDIQALVTAVQTGTVDMAYLGVANAGVLKGGAALNVVYVPYLFKNKPVVPEIVNGPLFQEMYDTLARESGVRIFASYGSRLPRAIDTVKGPIVKPADVKGMKIRVPPVEIIRATWEKLGAKPVVLGLSDIYMGLSRGNIDGQENGFDALIGFKWYEVTKYYSSTDQVYEVAAYYVNEKLWQSLSAAERQLLIRCAKVGGDAMTKAGEELEKDGIETIKKHGMVYTVPDREAFREALKDVHKSYEGKLWPAGLVDKIRALPQMVLIDREGAVRRQGNPTEPRWSR
jgi:tripartite ATP-independent transporter DctP family solute receptor